MSVILVFPTISECRLVFTYQRASSPSSAGQDQNFQRGLLALKENRLQDALEALTAAERDHPENARVRNFRGIVLGRFGQNGEAAAEYQEAIRLDSQMEDAYRNLGFLEWTQHQLERAQEALSHAVKLSPDDSFAHYYLGRVQLDAQLYAEAFRELEMSHLPWPADPEFLIEVATGYWELGEHGEVRKVLDQLGALSLSDAQSVHLASLLLTTHENEKAIHLLINLRERQPAGTAPWAQFDLALAYLFAGSYEKTLEQTQSCINLLSKTGAKQAELAPAWSLLGIAQARLGHGDQSIYALRQAATLNPSQEDDWLNLTRELMELSRFADATSATQEGIASNPNSYALQLRLGAANLAAGRYAEAETVFRALVVAGDPRPTSYIGLAQVLLREGRADEAASELAAAQQKLGAQFLISYFLGLSLDRAGKPLEAISAFQEAVRLNPSSAEAHLGLGKTELTSGRVKDSIVELEEANRLSPGNVQVRRLLSRAYHRAGDTKRATTYANTAAEVPPAVEGDLLGDFFLPKWQTPTAHNAE